MGCTVGDAVVLSPEVEILATEFETPVDNSSSLDNSASSPFVAVAMAVAVSMVEAVPENWYSEYIRRLMFL